MYVDQTVPFFYDLAGPPSPDDHAGSNATPAAGSAGPAGPGGDMAAEDMLQMALRMASEMTEEPMLDLEDNVDAAPVRRGVHFNSISRLHCVLEVVE